MSMSPNIFVRYFNISLQSADSRVSVMSNFISVIFLMIYNTTVEHTLKFHTKHEEWATCYEETECYKRGSKANTTAKYYTVHKLLMKSSN